MTFDSWHKFILQQNLLAGFNLTAQLLQELFSELDPHKKGYLSYNDWKNAFGSYDYHDQLLTELKALIKAQFANYDSAYKFMLTFGHSQTVDQPTFAQAVSQLSNERFSQEHIQHMWQKVSEHNQMDQFVFRKHFGSAGYSGSQTVVNCASSGRARSATIRSASTHVSKWETNVIDKIRAILRTSTRSMQEVFAEFNPDSNGQVT